jgi:hypothetical protein
MNKVEPRVTPCDLADRAFNGRRGHGGLKAIIHRQMTRRELYELLMELRDAERFRAAKIAMDHSDDDERNPCQLTEAIYNEILEVV